MLPLLTKSNKAKKNKNGGKIIAITSVISVLSSLVIPACNPRESGDLFARTVMVNRGIKGMGTQSYWRSIFKA
jgi:hypothetical protein